ncbi:FCD domain-containing protein, partial [Staphylococcus aureus]|uniref:FCD domain-containing protein n=1 Tax=Staphylococcus aureus TaxID=1280 RepID=UPI000A412EDB
FNVSRSPIRDAFKLLQQNQLIQLERMGAHVLPFGEQEKKEMYDLRLMLESFAFSRVKNQERLPIVKEMKKQHEMMKVAVKFEDAESFTKHDFEFHETFINAKLPIYALTASIYSHRLCGQLSKRNIQRQHVDSNVQTVMKRIIALKY